MFGDDWPLTVDEGILSCYLRDGGANREVVLKVGDVVYAINGIAKGSGRWAEIDPIWLDNPRIAGTKISLQPFLDAGLALCPG